MTDYKYLADRDRRRYYQDPISNGERLCIAVVFSLLGIVSTLFWVGVTA